MAALWQPGSQGGIQITELGGDWAVILSIYATQEEAEGSPYILVRPHRTDLLWQAATSYWLKRNPLLSDQRENQKSEEGGKSRGGSYHENQGGMFYKRENYASYNFCPLITKLYFVTEFCGDFNMLLKSRFDLCLGHFGA